MVGFDRSRLLITLFIPHFVVATAAFLSDTQSNFFFFTTKLRKMKIFDKFSLMNLYKNLEKSSSRSYPTFSEVI